MNVICLLVENVCSYFFINLCTISIVYQIGKSDLKALNSFIGAKKFMFGEKVCDTDAAVFGSLVELYYTDKGVFHQYIKS